MPQRLPRCFAPALRLPLEAEPGARAEYSDPGFILLGKALEVYTREYLATWARREVFEPLGLTATGFCPALDIAAFNSADRGGHQPFAIAAFRAKCRTKTRGCSKARAGHAGLFSNVPDLLRFAGEILSMPAAKPIRKPGKSAPF